VRQTAEKLAVETAVERLRVTLRPWTRGADAEAPELRDRLQSDTERLDRAADAIRAWTAGENDPPARVLGHRLLARIALRLWDVCRYSLSDPNMSISDALQRKQKHDVATGQRPISMLRGPELLESARLNYEAAYFLDPSRPETWVQAMVLTWALAGEPPDERFRNELRALRYIAGSLAERVGGEGLAGREARAMAAAMSFEVELLAYLVSAGELDPTRPQQRLDEAFERLLRVAAPVSESYRAHAMWRQLRRYEKWIEQAADPKPPDARQRVGRFRERLETLGVRRYWGPRA
jgi:hypothetical protein